LQQKAARGDRGEKTVQEESAFAPRQDDLARPQVFK
jgi:hypothetical protein